jgi:hypothetical protein
MNKELKQHVAILERSNEEHKRVTRKREKELEQIKNEYEQTIKNTSSLSSKVFIQFLFQQKSNIFIFFSVQNKM